MMIECHLLIIVCGTVLLCIANKHPRWHLPPPRWSVCNEWMNGMSRSNIGLIHITKGIQNFWTGKSLVFYWSFLQFLVCLLFCHLYALLQQFLLGSCDIVIALLRPPFCLIVNHPLPINHYESIQNQSSPVSHPHRHLRSKGSLAKWLQITNPS